MLKKIILYLVLICFCFCSCTKKQLQAVMNILDEKNTVIDEYLDCNLSKNKLKEILVDFSNYTFKINDTKVNNYDDIENEWKRLRINGYKDFISFVLRKNLNENDSNNIYIFGSRNEPTIFSKTDKLPEKLPELPDEITKYCDKTKHDGSAMIVEDYFLSLDKLKYLIKKYKNVKFRFYNNYNKLTLENLKEEYIKSKNIYQDGDYERITSFSLTHSIDENSIVIFANNVYLPNVTLYKEDNKIIINN